MAHLIRLNMAQIRIQFQIDNEEFDETPVPETERILQEIIGEIKAAWHNWDEKNKTTGFGLQEDELAKLLERGKMTGFGGLVVDKNGKGIGHWVGENIDERY